MTKHYTYGPSSSKRWMNCPGSIKLASGCPRTETIYSLQGTAAHAVGETALKEGTDAVCEDDEMRRCVQIYLDEIRSVEQSHEVIIRHTERTLEHGWLEKFGGTTDHFMIYVENGEIILHVFDYKHGAGVPIEVEENPQVLSYFAIIGSHFPGLIDKFRGTIVQPRTFNGDEVQTWECDLVRVRQHEQDVRVAMSLDHLKAGEHCRWCPAAIKCPELEAHTLEIAQTEFEVIRDDRERLAKLYEIAPAVGSLLKKLPMAMMEYFRDGRGGIPGFKVVAKRLSNRQWLLDKEQTIGLLAEQGIPKSEVVEESLKSPPQLEKVLPKDKRKVLEPLVTRRPTGYKVVPITEKGEPVNLDNIAANDFERIEDDDLIID